MNLTCLSGDGNSYKIRRKSGKDGARLCFFWPDDRSCCLRGSDSADDKKLMSSCGTLRFRGMPFKSIRSAFS